MARLTVQPFSVENNKVGFSAVFPEAYSRNDFIFPS